MVLSKIFFKYQLLTKFNSLERTFILSLIFFLLTLGLILVIFSIENSDKNNSQIFINLIRSLFIFFISIILISAVDANLKVIECTNCIDGIRKLNWNDINYGIILGSSNLISIIPSLIKIKKKQLFQMK